MPRRQVTAGFFRIQMLVVLGLSVLAVLTLDPDATPDGTNSARSTWLTAGCVALSCVAFIGSALWRLELRRAGTVVVFLLTAIAFAVLALSATGDWNAPAAGWRPLAELATAAVLGGTVTSMLLGHWYLTAPTMSIAPLSRLNTTLGLVTLLRLIVSAAVLTIAREHIQSQTHWLWLVLRWLAGIAGPLAAVILVWRILKYRNTQSATGVLFAAVILSFIGEMSATLLYRELSIPF